jgi:hypothetical protein
VVDTGLEFTDSEDEEDDDEEEGAESPASK